MAVEITDTGSADAEMYAQQTNCFSGCHTLGCLSKKNSMICKVGNEPLSSSQYYLGSEVLANLI